MSDSTSHCRAYFERLSEFLDGELDQMTAEDLEKHMNDCPECRVCLETFRQSVDVYKCVGDEPLPDGFVDALKDFIRSNSD